MLKLHTKDISLLSACTLTDRIIARITTNPNLPHALRNTHILLLKDNPPSHITLSPSHTEHSPSHIILSPAHTNPAPTRTEPSPSRTDQPSAFALHAPLQAEHLPAPIETPAFPLGFLAYFILAEDLENLALPESSGTSLPDTFSARYSPDDLLNNLSNKSSEDLPDNSQNDLPNNLQDNLPNDLPSTSPNNQLNNLPANFFKLPSHQSFMSDGDIVKFNPSNHRLSFLYRRSSNYNALLVTERCNNYCLMCSQPPKDIDDSYIVNELLTAIPLMSRDTPEIGITGGEPTLLGADLPRLLRTLKGYLPSTSVHVLSNGRNFTELKFTGTIAAVDHPDLMFGIPIYSDIANIHDYVVQADGAFDETIRGIINLKRYKQKVEIRVVIHKQTFERLPQLAEFIARNLTFVDHVALMGLEMMGFTKFNLDELWIDPVDYQPQLKSAVQTLFRARIRTSIYNHQLCLLDPSLWPFNTRSISDWKNEYMPECTPCTKRAQCGGFFSSARLRYSEHLTAFTSSTNI